MKKQILLFAFSILCIALYAQDKKQYTIIVSLDGFRWDYPTLYNTPNLDKVAEKGVSATIISSFPSSTFPNHYTLATGLFPDHHGIVNNLFWDTKKQRQYAISDSVTRNDPKYYLGEPIWITAQKQGIKTGSLYWIGSDIPIKGNHPTYYKIWADTPRLDFAQRVDTAVAWLSKPEEERPRLIMLYIEEPDGTGHRFGPKSMETGMMVHRMDSLMGVLTRKISALPIADRINVIITADHGMTEISKERVVNIPHNLKEEWIEAISGFTPTSIFTKAGYRDSVYDALKELQHVHVWKKENIPSELNYGTSDRIGDIIVAPELGWQFTNRVSNNVGAHGYFPQSPDMQAIFRAYGPGFKKGYSTNSFINIDIYPLLAHLLGIVPEVTDGQLERVKDMLK